jgi:hypothetical protein
MFVGGVEPIVNTGHPKKSSFNVRVDIHLQTIVDTLKYRRVVSTSAPPKLRELEAAIRKTGWRVNLWGGVLAASLRLSIQRHLSVKLEQIKDEIRKLSRTDKIEIYRWLDDQMAADLLPRIGAYRSTETDSKSNRCAGCPTEKANDVNRVCGATATSSSIQS